MDNKSPLQNMYKIQITNNNICLNILTCNLKRLQDRKVCLYCFLKKILAFSRRFLCNVIYKIITKVLANRLKLILPNVILATKCAFVPGRLIINNVLVAFEMVNTIRQRKRGRKGCMLIKLHMSKIYDRVELSFLEKVKQKLGFHESITHLIMSLNKLFSTRFSLMVFLPMLLNLFVLFLLTYLFCVEVLSSMLWETKTRLFNENLCL